MTDRTSRRHLLLGAAALAAALPATARAEADPAALADIRRRALAMDQLHSLIVAVQGQPVLELAKPGRSLDRVANVKSVSKTLIATLVGIALDRGLLRDVDQPVLPLLGRYAPPAAGLDPRVGQITLAHLLSMRSGLRRSSGANYGAMVSSRDWVAHVLRQPFEDVPGGRMLYSTGDWHLLSAVLTVASGASTAELARDWLARPLDIAIPPWTRDPRGIYLGGNEMALSPRGMLRFGEMIRRGGAIDGRRVVSESWLRESWMPRTHSPWSGDAYGYGWFLTRLAGRDLRYARGYGGQMIYLVPELSAVVTVTSDPDRPARGEGHVGELRRLLAEAVLPALA